MCIRDRIYVVRGTSDDITAKAALAAAAPATYDGLVRQTLQLERTAEQVWECSVRYGLLEPLETGDSTFQFDTGGGTQHITQSLQTIASYAPPGETAQHPPLLRRPAAPEQVPEPGPRLPVGLDVEGSPFGLRELNTVHVAPQAVP